MRVDALIAGAGPSGVASALSLKRMAPELSVCVVDPGRRTPSVGEGLPPPAGPILKELGLWEDTAAKSPNEYTALNNLGTLLDSMGDYAAARRYLEQSLAIRKEVQGEKHPDTATALNNLGALLKSMGDYAAARPYFEQALADHVEQFVVGTGDRGFFNFSDGARADDQR